MRAAGGRVLFAVVSPSKICVIRGWKRSRPVQNPTVEGSLEITLDVRSSAALPQKFHTRLRTAWRRPPTNQLQTKTSFVAEPPAREAAPFPRGERALLRGTSYTHILPATQGNRRAERASPKDTVEPGPNMRRSAAIGGDRRRAAASGGERRRAAASSGERKRRAAA